LLEARQPTGIVTKNAVVLRDRDLLTPMAAKNLVHVFLSVTTLNGDLARQLEPRTASPEAKLKAIRELSAVGVPVGFMLAPIIPRLNDCEIPEILEACYQAGAQSANYLLLRLPHAVRPMFLQWLETKYPNSRPRVESLIKTTRSGALNDSQFGRRYVGEGDYAIALQNTFRIFSRRFGLHRRLTKLDSSQFRPPRAAAKQMWLF